MDYRLLVAYSFISDAILFITGMNTILFLYPIAIDCAILKIRILTLNLVKCSFSG